MNVTRSKGNMPEPSRRDFLKLSTSALVWASVLVGLAGIFRFLDYQDEPPPKTTFDLGPTSKYPIGSRTLLPDIPAMLIHTQAGFTALSLICTHLGCTVEQSGTGFKCPCHGSRYDAQGKVLRGPALKPLPTLRIEIAAEDHLLVHTA